MAKRWEDLKNYEKQLEQREASSAGSENAEPSSAKTNKERLKQLKCGANKKFSSFKSQLSDICRWDSYYLIFRIKCQNNIMTAFSVFNVKTWITKEERNKLMRKWTD